MYISSRLFILINKCLHAITSENGIPVIQGDIIFAKPKGSFWQCVPLKADRRFGVGSISVDRHACVGRECGGVWSVSNKTRKTCDRLGHILRGPIQFSSDIIYESSTLPHGSTSTQNLHYYATWYTRTGFYITLWVFQSGRILPDRSFTNSTHEGFVISGILQII